MVVNNDMQERTSSWIGVPEQPMPDILYIMGMGRSGTTILDILLSNNPGICGVGELNHIFQHAFLQNRLCSCGQEAHKCNMWSNVLSMADWGTEDCKRIADTIERVERHGNFLWLWAGLARERYMSVYKYANEVLYKTISAVTGCNVIVDSSKNECRGLVLSKLFTENVKVLCITRSPAGVITAYQKEDNDEQLQRRALFPVTIYYLYVLLCMWIVRMRLKERCLSVRFEDLKRDPGAVLDSIESWYGYKLAAAREKLAERDWFRVGHIVSGNRIRKKGEVKFEPELAEPIIGGFAGAVTRVLDACRRYLGF